MPETGIGTPRHLVERLLHLFPSFSQVWDGGRSYGYTGTDYTYHCVFQEFAPECAELLGNAAPSQLQAFSGLLNSMVEEGGEQENAVSTCLLEHASQVGIRDLIAPWLSEKARAELR